MNAVSSKPRLRFAQILNMSMGFFGIQFAFALQNANASRIFETLGAAVDEIPILWIAAPLTGLIVQPIIGYLSDHTWTRFGRRRPYFFVGAVLTTIALFFFPNSPALWVAAIGLWILDISVNITMEPFRAFVGDNLPHAQRTLGYASQSLLIGTGAVVASLLPSLMDQIGVSNVSADGGIPDTVIYSFYCGGLVLLAAVCWTVFTSHEYTSEQLEEFAKAESAGQSQAAASLDESAQSKSPHPFCGFAVGSLLVGLALAVTVYSLSLLFHLYVLSAILVIGGLMFLVSHFLQDAGRRSSGFYEVMDALFTMPQTMRRLAVTQFFAWFALFSMWIYTTNTVASKYYGAASSGSELFNEAGNYVGVLFAVYNGVAALVALLIPWLSRLLGRKLVFALFLAAGGLGMMSFLWIDSRDTLYLSMVGIGLSWSAILSIPYAMLSSAVPHTRMGLYMGVFNFFIVLPQILAASILGPLVEGVFDDQSIYALMLGGLFFLIAAAWLYFVPDPHGESPKLFRPKPQAASSTAPE